MPNNSEEIEKYKQTRDLKQQNDFIQFGSIYYGQKVLCFKFFERYPNLEPTTIDKYFISKVGDCDGYLKLRDIKSLTDKEKLKLVELSKLWDKTTDTLFEVNYMFYADFIIERITYGGEISIFYSLPGYYTNISFRSCNEIIDYLRSIGVLIGYKNYTKEQILELGWAVIE